MSYFVQTNLEQIESMIGPGSYGMIIYVFITIIDIVIAPISTFPLISLASNLWGVFPAALLSIIGWSVGAYIAFFLARRYGVRIVRKFISIEKVHEIEKKIPDENIFWSIVFLRVVLPVDILSYALGLFSKIKTRDYVLATFIGTIPFAFIFAYLGVLPFILQVSLLTTAFLLLVLGYFTKKTIDKRKERKERKKMKEKLKEEQKPL